MKNFDEFKTAIFAEMDKLVDEELFIESIEETTTRKCNDKFLTGLMVKTSDSNIAPCIYLNSYYERYQDGTDFETVAGILKNDIMKHLYDSVKVPDISDIEMVKENIFPCICMTKWNEDFLAEIPHRSEVDLSVYYRINLMDGNATTRVTYPMLTMWDISEDEIHEWAINNMNSIMTFESMQTIMRRMFDVDDDSEAFTESPDNMYIMTTNRMKYGASVIVCPALLQSIRDRFNSDLYIIPSSIHEVIIMPKCTLPEDADIENLKDMVRSVNSTMNPEDVLSDHIYIFNEKGLNCL